MLRAVEGGGTRHEGRCHRCPGERAHIRRPRERRRDVDARRGQVPGVAEIGETRHLVLDVARADGQRGRHVRRRDLARVRTAFPGGNCDGHHGGEAGDSVVELLVGHTADAENGDRGLMRVLRHPGDARDDVVGGAAAVLVEHADREDLRALGDAVTAPGDDAGDARAVAVGVGGVGAGGQKVLARRHAALKVRVLRVDTAVDHVHRDVRSVGFVVVLLVEAGPLVDPVESPARWVGLGAAGGERRRLHARHQQKRHCRRQETTRRPIPHDCVVSRSPAGGNSTSPDGLDRV